MLHSDRRCSATTTRSCSCPKSDFEIRFSKFDRLQPVDVVLKELAQLLAVAGLYLQKPHLYKHLTYQIIIAWLSCSRWTAHERSWHSCWVVRG